MRITRIREGGDRQNNRGFWPIIGTSVNPCPSHLLSPAGPAGRWT
jgi:hypothetical protein